MPPFSGCAFRPSPARPLRHQPSPIAGLPRPDQRTGMSTWASRAICGPAWPSTIRRRTSGSGSWCSSPAPTASPRPMPCSWNGTPCSSSARWAASGMRTAPVAPGPKRPLLLKPTAWRSSRRGGAGRFGGSPGECAIDSGNQRRPGTRGSPDRRQGDGGFRSRNHHLPAGSPLPQSQQRGLGSAGPHRQWLAGMEERPGPHPEPGQTGIECRYIPRKGHGCHHQAFSQQSQPGGAHPS
jgi:hypothetical protein